MEPGTPFISIILPLFALKNSSDNILQYPGPFTFSVILEVDVNGVMNIGKIFDCVSIFIMPPSLEVLENRLLSRKTESYGTVKKRLKQACVEVKSVFNYDYVVVNDSVSGAVSCFNAIILAEKHRIFRMKVYLNKFLNENNLDLK